MIDRLERIPARVMGWIFLAVFTAITFVIFSGMYRKPFEPGTRTVVADFESASQLYAGDEVRLEGNIDGKVKSVKARPGGDGILVTMEVNKDAGPIYADASARLKNKTLLAGSFYVEIDRGEKSAGPIGSRVISRSNTHVQVELDDVLDIFREDAIRGGLQTLPGEMAKALADKAPLPDAIRTANDVAPSASSALEALRGQDPGQDLPRLVQATAKTVRALDSGNDDVRELVAGAAATLRTTGRRQAEIRETIDAAPSVTYDLTTTLARLDSTLTIADGLVDRLEPGVPLLAPALSSLRPALENTRGLLETARPLLAGSAAPLLTNLGDAADLAIPLLSRLQPALRKVDKTILPYFHRVDPETGRSTTVMIGGTAAGFGGASAQQDENGHFIRFPATIGTSSVYLPCKSSLVDQTASSLLACDKFNDAVTEYLNYLPDLNGKVPQARAAR
jgi:virulence factor Mce-like protein